MLQNTIPMCSSQYERMFNTSRIPGLETGRVIAPPLIRPASQAPTVFFFVLFFKLTHGGHSARMQS